MICRNHLFIGNVERTDVGNVTEGFTLFWGGRFGLTSLVGPFKQLRARTGGDGRNFNYSRLWQLIVC